VSSGDAAPRGRRVTVVLAVLVLLAGAALVVRAVTGGPGTEGPEAGFARDMSTHHAQAVRMSFIIRDRTDDPDVRLLAYDIITTQQAQIGMMTAWLDEWGLPKTDPARGVPGDTSDERRGGAEWSLPGISRGAQLE
jgi:uncharacterized protein YceK